MPKAPIPSTLPSEASLHVGEKEISRWELEFPGVPEYKRTSLILLTDKRLVCLGVTTKCPKDRVALDKLGLWEVEFNKPLEEITGISVVPSENGLPVLRADGCDIATLEVGNARSIGHGQEVATRIRQQRDLRIRAKSATTNVSVPTPPGSTNPTPPAASSGNVPKPVNLEDSKIGPRPTGPISQCLGIGLGQTVLLEYRQTAERKGLLHQWIGHQFTCYDSKKNLLFTVRGTGEPIQDLSKTIVSRGTRVGPHEGSHMATYVGGEADLHLASWRQTYFVHDRNQNLVAQVLHIAGSDNGMSDNPRDGESRVALLSGPGTTVASAEKRRLSMDCHRVRVTYPSGQVVAQVDKFTTSEAGMVPPLFGKKILESTIDLYKLAYVDIAGNEIGHFGIDTNRPSGAWTGSGTMAFKLETAPGTDTTALLLASVLHGVTPISGRFNIDPIHTR